MIGALLVVLGLGYITLAVGRVDLFLIVCLAASLAAYGFMFRGPRDRR